MHVMWLACLPLCSSPEQAGEGSDLGGNRRTVLGYPRPICLGCRVCTGSCLACCGKQQHTIDVWLQVNLGYGVDLHLGSRCVGSSTTMLLRMLGSC
jgi:hypothetical protein